MCFEPMTYPLALCRASALRLLQLSTGLVVLLPAVAML